MTRNPKDVCVSFYNHWQIFEGFDGSFEVFVSAFLNDVCGYNTPFIQHVLEFWNYSQTAEGQKHVLFIMYEDMKRDLDCVCQKVGRFLGKPINESQLSTLVDHLSFEKMKHNPSVNKSEIVEVHYYYTHTKLSLIEFCWKKFSTKS